MFTSVVHDLVVVTSLMTVVAYCRSIEFDDVDEVDTYTRILLHPKNDSQQVKLGGALRAISEGPLIIDYPFPIHHYIPPTSGAEFPVRLHHHHGHNADPDTHENQATGHHFGHFGFGHLPNLFHSMKKKKKKFHKKKYSTKNLMPLIVTFMLKISHLLPTLKLILLALFSLVLFAKKAFLVSVGTLLLVLFQHMTSKHHSTGLTLGTIGLWKDRDQTAHRTHNYEESHSDLLPEGIQKLNADWWQLEGTNGTKIMPRDDIEKWKRWWAPQIKDSHVPGRFRPPQLEEQSSFKDRIKEQLSRIFGTENSHR